MNELQPLKELNQTGALELLAEAPSKVNALRVRPATLDRGGSPAHTTSILIRATAGVPIVEGLPTKFIESSKKIAGRMPGFLTYLAAKAES